MTAVRRVLAAVGLAAVAGCAACPPFRAAWYLHDPVPPSPAAPASGIYLALLNEGDRAVKVTGAVVNPARYRNADEALSVSPGESEWQPGELRVFLLATLGSCDLPVAVRLECGDGCKPRTVTVSGVLPNALTDVWLSRCPRKPEGTTP